MQSGQEVSWEALQGQVSSKSREIILLSSLNSSLCSKDSQGITEEFKSGKIFPTSGHVEEQVLLKACVFRE